MSSLLDTLSPAETEALRETEMPEWTEPMLATLTDERFSDPDWIYERKLDGVRLLVFRREGGVRLMTRNRKERSATYPEVVEALGGLDGPAFVADGEVVAFASGTDGGTLTSFSRLQRRMQVGDEAEARRRAGEVPVVLYLFDLLWVDGRDVTGLPLRTRKSLLRRALDFEDPLRYTPHRNEGGVAYWEEACEKGWEGVIAKDATAPYVHSRSRRWLKFKCVREQEFVVGGFTEPKGSRVGFGALLLGTYEDGTLVYRGKVGTGWDDAALRELRDRMDGMERESPPFGDVEEGGEPPSGEGVHWIEPELVVEVGFTEWTDDGRLRHPRYEGLRTDKDPEDVVRERPS